MVKLKYSFCDTQKRAHFFTFSSIITCCYYYYYYYYDTLFLLGVEAFPPGKVTDLRVSVDDGTAEVTLSWTATGADLDQGTGTGHHLHSYEA